MTPKLAFFKKKRLLKAQNFEFLSGTTQAKRLWGRSSIYRPHKPTPLEKKNSEICMGINAEKAPPPPIIYYTIQLKSAVGLTNCIGGGHSNPQKKFIVGQWVLPPFYRGGGTHSTPKGLERPPSLNNTLFRLTDVT